MAPLRRRLLGAVCLRLQRESGEIGEIYTFSFPDYTGGPLATETEGSPLYTKHAADAGAAAAVGDYEAAESIQSFLTRTELISCWLPQQQQVIQQQQQQQQHLVSFSVCAHAIEEVANLAAANAAAAAECGELSNLENRRVAERFLCQWRRPFAQRRDCCGQPCCCCCCCCCCCLYYSLYRSPAVAADAALLLLLQLLAARLQVRRYSSQLLLLLLLLLLQKETGAPCRERVCYRCPARPFALETQLY